MGGTDTSASTTGDGRLEYRWVHTAKPRVKSRPRRGQGRTYTEKQVVVAEQEIAAAYDGPKFEGPIEVEIDLHADYWVVTIRESDRNKSNLRGDVDNYCKLMLDGLQGVAYENDAQVTVLTGIKS